MTTVKEFWEMQCPNCGDDSALAVQALIWVTLHGDGTEDEGGDHEWDDKAKAMCKACGWNGSIIQCQEAFTNPDWKAIALSQGWIELDADPDHPESGPCLFHPTLERFWPGLDYEGAARDLLG
jgi:predicted RNA-binding Zn-ribbon protein involved in translation (DUF1610 family)